MTREFYVASVLSKTISLFLWFSNSAYIYLSVSSLRLCSAPPSTARAVVHRALITDQQNSRRGTASTLTRDEVCGSGKKPCQQKKTGRARRGSQRTPSALAAASSSAPSPVTGPSRSTARRSASPSPPPLPALPLLPMPLPSRTLARSSISTPRHATSSLPSSAGASTLPRRLLFLPLTSAATSGSAPATLAPSRCSPPAPSTSSTSSTPASSSSPGLPSTISTRGMKLTERSQRTRTRTRTRNRRVLKTTLRLRAPHRKN